ncbi:hypothetical protein SAMN05444166_3100 [Singulisphaera sp. GP187]|nr:hypothetical protein SAMN05444166_3100 [Singulisphaera sp. GP187]
MMPVLYSVGTEGQSLRIRNRFKTQVKWECLLGLARTGSEYGTRGPQTSFIYRFTLSLRDRL